MSSELKFFKVEADKELSRGTTSDGLQSSIEPKKNQLKLQPHHRELDKDEQHVAKVLPAHACKYCGIHEPATLAMCNICKKWFCNGRGITSASHILDHLLGAKHRGITLHADGPLGEKIIKCFVCGKCNIFNMGYIVAKADGGMKLLCRHPCAARSLEWRPVVAERSISPCLVKQPSEQDQLRVRQPSAAQVKKLEELWLKNDEATIEDVQEMRIDSKPSPVLLQYENAAQYERIFCTLMQLQAEYDKKLTEQATQHNIQVRWHVGLDTRIVADFNLAQTDAKLKIMHGDALRLRYLDANSKPFGAIGLVIKLPDIHGDGVGLKMKISTNACITSIKEVSVDFIWKCAALKRMQYALSKFKKQSATVSSHLQRKLLGKTADEMEATSFPGPWPNQWHAPDLPSLNAFQIHAVEEALKNELTLIQGPPGTGKTVTAASIVYHLVKKHGGRVLVCAPSNTAVDVLAEKIHLANIKVVRVYAKGRENTESPVSFLALHNQVSQMDWNPELTKLQQLKAKIGELNSDDESRYLSLLRDCENEILLAADVICCTCIGAGDMRLSRIQCRSVLIDEAGQATEPECLVPVMLGAKQLILVGDQCQLGPVVMCKEAADAGLTQSLFERLILLGMRPIRLALQYRMHPELALFPSNHFYEGSLQNAVTAEDRRLKVDFPWPQADRPMFFLASLGQEEIAGSGTSYLNAMEAINVEKVATYFLKSFVKPQQIGIITPYEGQRAYLVQHMVHKGRLYEEIEVANVDAFQGREKDLIIVSCVRSNEHEQIGFLKDPRRLNVAITRAKYGLIIVGNPQVLAKQPLWADLLSFFKQRKVLVEGSLNNLKESLVHIQKHKKSPNAENIDTSFNSSLVDHTKKQQVPAVRGGSATQLPHDPIGYKSNVHTAASLRNMPVPRGVLKSVTNMAPQCYNQNQMAIEAAKQSRPASRANASWTTNNGKKK